MTDRELLELAAKAYGPQVECVFHAGKNEYQFKFFPKYPNTDFVFDWDPLTDDGDALRLAVALGFNVDVYRKHALQNNPSVVVRGYESRRLMAAELAEDNGASLELATRRAIVRAAAEIQLHKERNRG